jgi:L-cysteine/cystine lyase
VVAPFLPDDEKLAAVREALPAVGAGIYLDTPVAGPLPAETARSMADLAGWEVTTGRAGRDRREEALSRVDEARGAVAAILTTDVDGVALTHGEDHALAIVAGGIEWRRGDNVVVERNLAAGVAAISPADVPQLAFTAGGAVDPMAALDHVLTPRTRVVFCPHVDPATGARLPISELAALVHGRGAILAVDGSQAAGAIPVEFDELGADFYVISGSTWLLGPEGIGALAAAPSHRDRLLQLRQGSGTLAPAVRDTPAAFDFHLPSVVGLGRSCGWLSMYVGLDWIHGRAASLARHARDRLASIDGVEVLTPLESLATIVSFRVGGWSPERLLEELGARVFVIASVVPSVNAVRIGTGFFNTEDEIARLGDAVELLAGHTPATLPPRRRLTVLGGAS